MNFFYRKKTTKKFLNDNNINIMLFFKAIKLIIYYQKKTPLRFFRNTPKVFCYTENQLVK